MSNRTKTILFAVALLVIGIGILVWSAGNVIKGSRSKSWPSTEGVVISSEVKVKTSTDSKKYKVFVKYSYSVEGKKLTGDTVSFAKHLGLGSAEAHEITDRYPVGKKVSVYYNPKKPQTSVLEPGIGLVTFLPLLLGAILAVTGTVFLIKFFRGGAIEGIEIN